ncbi:hypothetical protein PFICI_13814 [Pestalotiopsis fici W106-1]|uniref:AA1-like domain-containing protein n=1 Tax=Pestalotiopsis fici (strain W106-1 / CGMCC3.15140) TaxID=1229662 RepID=W3WJ94_PESFW|nr:uncharacterized protein PFICI_13814 [Pestalotiopsis fici W106-1]ETS73948.1 hypothetical protein PFICI_13814 [Pestalotiopsis fici W106-1]
MRFSSAISLALGTVATASPVRRDYTEDISITDFYVHKAIANGTTNATVDGVSFLLTGENATDLACSAQTGIPSAVFSCGDSPYSFALWEESESTGEFTLRLYHALGVAVGYYGAGVVPTYCHAGGGPTLTCGQVVTPVNITIDSLPDSA